MSYLVKTFIAAALFTSAICSSIAVAADVTYFPTVSHTKEKNIDGEGWNTKTNGVKMEFENGLAIGTLKNSYFKQSSYIAYTYRPIKMGAVEAGVLGGLISGYDSAKIALKFPAMVVGTIKLHLNEKSFIEVLAVPTVRTSSGWVSVGIGVKF